jgi:hypothetical protein
LFRTKAAAAKADDDDSGTMNTMNTADRQARGRSRTTRPKNLDSGDGDEDDPPTIGRVPTAMGYHSDDSVEEDERSQYSRYDISRKEPRQNPKLGGEAEDEEDSVDNDDRYSHYGTPKLESLWSDSDNSLPPQWKSWSNDEEDRSGLDRKVAPNQDGKDASSKNPSTKKKAGEDASSKNPSTKKKAGDDTSSKNPSLKKKVKEETKVEEEVKVEEKAAVEKEDAIEEEPVAQDVIPAVMSDTSSLTDPLFRGSQATKAEKTQQKMEAQNANKMKKVNGVKALPPPKEGKDEARARMTADLVDRLISEKKPSKRDRRKSKPMTSTNARRDNKKDAPRKGYFQRRRKDEDTDSKRASSTSKDAKNPKKKAKPVEDGETFDNDDDVSATDAKVVTSEDKRNMYSKSLLTDDSNANTKEVDEESDYAEDEDQEDDDFEQLPYVNSLRLKRKPSQVEKARKAAVVELDEYSVEAEYSNGYDDPQLVQCLKFYSCGFAAAAIGVGINTATCRYPLTITEEIPMDEIEAARINDENKILSPRPNVEVVLEGYRLDGAPRDGRQDDDEESTLVEAPDIQLPHTRSYVKEVTSLHLQLDEYEDDERQSQAGTRQLNEDDSEEWDMPIRSIDVPGVSTDDDSHNDESEASANATASASARSASARSESVIVVKSTKRKGIRGMFSRLRKQKELPAASTAPSTDEASNRPIEMAME